MTRKERILEILKVGPLTATEIRERDGGKSKHVQAALAELHGQGEIFRVPRRPEPKNNCSFAYSLTPAVEQNSVFESEGLRVLREVRRQK